MLPQITEILGLIFIIIGLFFNIKKKLISKVQIFYGFVIILYSRLLSCTLFEKFGVVRK